MSKAEKALAASESQGFPRAYRITRKADYDAVFRGGRKRVSPYLVCYLLQKPEGNSRLGLAVSRKVGPAVIRNRVKRCLRECFRRLRPGLTVPLDIVVVARPACAGLSNAALTRDFEKLLRPWREAPQGESEADKRG